MPLAACATGTAILGPNSVVRTVTVVSHTPLHSQMATENKKVFTEKQGQYLAFIYYYEKLNRRAPAEADLERYFRVSPPSIHDMVLRLEAGGLIARTPGVGRSIRLLVPASDLPNLK